MAKMSTFVLKLILAFGPIWSTTYAQAVDAANNNNNSLDASAADGLHKATDKFGLALFQSIAASNPGVNLFLSPLSINSALFLTYLGAQNTTKDELRTTLALASLNQPDSALSGAYAQITDILRSGNQASGKGNYKLNLANQICLDQALHINPQFLGNSEVRAYDFQHNPQAAQSQINQFVANATHGKIHNLLQPGQIDTQTQLVVINAIYFKADWQYQFDKSATSERAFYSYTDETVASTGAKFMQIRRRFYYAELDDVQMVEIPYKSEEVSMLILLPPKNDTEGLEKLERSLSVQFWQTVQERTDLMMVDLIVPKFKLEESYDLVEPLKNIGVRQLFGGEVDLGGMIEDGVAGGVGAIVHKSFVDVNEEGTEAAAATGVVFSRSAVFTKPDEVKLFQADHPFLFAIRHNPTNLLLFLGRIQNPPA